MTDKDKPNVGAAPDAPGAPDSHLRDARLAQALQHMPDAHMQAGAQARLAVLQHAQEALASTPRPADSAAPPARRWWHWLLGTSGRQRTSHTAWGGALVSVLVASFITLMWYDQPVPDASPDMPVSMGKAESAGPATTTSTAASTAPAADMEQAKRQEPVMAAPHKQDALKESRKAVASNNAETPPLLQSDPPAEVQAAAPPPPAPAPMVAAPAQRARADMPLARMSHAPAPASPPSSPTATSKARSEVVEIQSGNRARSVPERQADALLAYLRELRDARDLRAQGSQAAGQVAEQMTQPVADTIAPTITVRTAQGERWEIGPTQVRLQGGDIFAITPAQYETLRKLIDRATAP